MTKSLAGIIPGIIDAHIHQWDPFTTPRTASPLAPVYKRFPGLLTRLMPLLVAQGNREMIRTPEFAAQPFLPPDYARDVAGVPAAVGVPVESVVHVQADWKAKGPLGAADETAWLESLPWGREGNPELAAIVGHADPREPHFADLLDAHLAASARFRGIRCLGTWHEDKGTVRYADGPGMFRSREFLRGFAALAERKLTFDAYVYSGQLSDVGFLATEYPETTVVLDHFGPPIGWLGPMGKGLGRSEADREAYFEEWREGITALAAQPNVVAKVSGLAFPTLGMPTVRWSRADIVEQVAPLVLHTANSFGPDRLVFGSNFPMDKAITDYPNLPAAVLELLGDRGDDLMRKVFRENAQRVYGI